jgi:hypothetical protein
MERAIRAAMRRVGLSDERAIGRALCADRRAKKCRVRAASAADGLNILIGSSAGIEPEAVLSNEARHLGISFISGA